jgi:predicted nucleic acid-binding protein
VVVDTSAWIEILVGSPLASSLADHLPHRDDCVVPTLVQLELTKWLNRQENAEASTRVLAFTMRCRVVPLSTGIALRAAYLCKEHGLSTADGIIYATAIDQNADLLTCDAHFRGLEGVTFVPK